MTLDPGLALAFQRDGFILVKSVFSQQEVSTLISAIAVGAEKERVAGRIVRPHTGEIAPLKDLVSIDGLGDLIFDERVVRLARLLLGVAKPVYFGDSGIMVGGALRGFHKDNSNRDDKAHRDWQSPYNLIRFGIYLQDHARFSGGLRLRIGSHLHADVSSGRSYAVPSEPGDLVIWNLRTTHSGHAVRFRGLPELPLQPRVEFRLPRALVLPEPSTRTSAFLTYGAHGVHLETYLEKHLNQETYKDNYLYKRWLHNCFSEEIEARAVSAGVEFLRPLEQYGSLSADSVVYPDGFVPTGKSVPDVYPAVGVERVIQAAGKIFRAVVS